MKLKPLQQWICDTCGQLIEKSEDGWVEWLRDDDGKVHSFYISHHATRSPLGDCYFHKGPPNLALSDMIGNVSTFWSVRQ